MEATKNKRPKRSKMNVSFGKGAEVISKKESTHEGLRGEITTGEPNKDGEFEVKFVGESGRTEHEFIHGNDLELAMDSGEVQDQPESNAPDDGSRQYVITKAKIKDDFCHYSFEITKGINAGEEHTVKVDNIISPDMTYAFERLHVHLAVIDDVFKVAGRDIEDIDTLHNDELTLKYFVTGFAIAGGESDESVILIGSKHLSVTHGRMDITTPKIPLDNLSSYKWYNELKAAIDRCREEVALYKEGKYELPIEEEKKKKSKAKQLTIGDQMDDASEDEPEDNNGEEHHSDNELESARV